MGLHYRMEQVWVQAAVDYYPSRAAKNYDADSWVDMDTSFKQYDYLTGMDLNVIAPFDAYAFTQSYQASTTIDPYGGITCNLKGSVPFYDLRHDMLLDTGYIWRWRI